MDEEHFRKDPNKEEFKRLCYQMAWGDDSNETFDKYCLLQGLILSPDEKKKLKEDIFYD